MRVPIFTLYYCREMGGVVDVQLEFGLLRMWEMHLHWQLGRDYIDLREVDEQWRMARTRRTKLDAHA